MKKQVVSLRSVRRLSLALGLAALTFTGVQKIHAQNNPPPPLNPFSSMTYQGKLDDFSGGPADGRFDFRISAVTPPVPCFGTDCGWFTNCPDCSTVLLGTNTVNVANGLFTLPINMPTGMVHTVNGTFLKFEVRPSGSGEFTTLLPMQPITAVPLAAVAQSVVGPIPASALTGQMPTGMITGVLSSPLSLLNQANVFVGDGSQLANVNATTIGGVAPCDLPCLQNFWKLTGNDNATTNSFIGTPTGNNNWLEMRVNGKRALRLIPDDHSPNILGGSPDNTIGLGSRGSVIAGGGAVSDPAFDDMAPNRILGANLYEFIGGGFGNSSSGGRNVIGGGQHNTINANGSVIGGGTYNLITPSRVDGGAIGGGSHNTITGSSNTNLPCGDAAFIGAGIYNTATNTAAFIGAGEYNVAGGAYSAISGGSGNIIEIVDYGPQIGVALSDGAFIGGGFGNRIPGGLYGAILGGRNNRVGDSTLAAVVLGGENNAATTSYSVTSGNGAVSRHEHSETHGSMFAQAGDAQSARYTLTTITPGNISQLLNGPRPPVGSAIAFTALISAKAFGDASAGFEVKGLIRNYGTQVSLVGSPTVTPLGRDAALASATVAVEVNAGALTFRVSSGSQLNVRWVGSLQTSEVSF